MTTVSLIPCTSYNLEDVRQAVIAAAEPFGGIEGIISPRESVLLKPNFLQAAAPETAVCTHPVVVEAVASLVLDRGAQPYIADSPAWGSAKGVAKANGIADVCKRLGIPLFEMKKARKVKHPDLQVFEHLTVDKLALTCDKIINLPKLKAHSQLYFTCATKNMFGCVTGKRKAWWHAKAGEFDNFFGMMLVETMHLLNPALTIVDSIVGMEGQGPGKGDPREVGLIAAGTDTLAIDRVLVDVIGFDPDKVCYFAAARELGIGETDLAKIAIHGAPIDECRIAGFQEPDKKPIGFSLPRVAKSTMKQAWLTKVKGA